MIDESEGLGTPHEAFCRIVAVIHPENPGLGKKVTGPHWHYEFPRDSRDALAIGNALRFLNANVSGGKISAQGIRKGTEHDGPKPINLGELRTGVLKVWDETFEIQNEGRLYRNVFLSMADLNRELGAPRAKEQTAKAPNGAKIDTGRPLKHDWEGAVLATMAWLHAEGIPTQPKPVADEMRRWFTNVGKTDPADSEIASRASRILKAIKDAMKK